MDTTSLYITTVDTVYSTVVSTVSSYYTSTVTAPGTSYVTTKAGKWPPHWYWSNINMSYLKEVIATIDTLCGNLQSNMTKTKSVKLRILYFDQ